MLNHRNTAVFFILLLAAMAVAGRYTPIGTVWYVIVAVAWISLMAAGSVFLSMDFYLKSHHRGNGENALALTFDDGPHSEHTPAVLDLLKQHGIKAAFFVIGRNATQYPALIRRIDQENHVLGGHSFSHHNFFDLFPARKMREELKQTAEAVEEVTGRRMRWFRPPYSVTNPTLSRALKQTGYLSIGWSLKSRDTVVQEPEAVVNRILEKVQPGDMILFHDNRKVTAAVLALLIPALKERGFSFARPDELLKLDAYEKD